MRKHFILATILAASMCLLTACGGEADNYGADYHTNTAMDAVAPSYANELNVIHESVEEDAGTGNPSENTMKKLIRKVSMTLETDTDEFLNQQVEDIVALANQYGGYVENQRVERLTNYAQANMTARIPKNKTDGFLKGVQYMGLKMTNLNDSFEDVTLQYVDIETRLDVKKDLRDKYVGYLKQAQTIDEMLRVESELNQVVADIESYQSQKNVMDHEIDYTEVRINIDCRSLLNKLTFGDRFHEEFENFGEDFSELLFGLIKGFMYTLTWLVFAIPILFIMIRSIMFIVKMKFPKRPTKGPKPPTPKKPSGRINPVTPVNPPMYMKRDKDNSRILPLKKPDAAKPDKPRNPDDRA